MTFSDPRRNRRRVALATSAAVAASLGLATVGITGTTASADTSTTTGPAAPPALLSAVPANGRGTAPANLTGTSSPVALHTRVLPQDGSGQRLTVPLSGRRTATVRLTDVEHEHSHTSWAGAVEGDPLSSFTMVRTGSTYRGSLISPSTGIHTITEGERGDYWLTKLSPLTLDQADDAVHIDAHGKRVHRDDATVAGGDVAGRVPNRKVKIRVMFGYTRKAKREAGGRAGLKSSAALVITQTNQSFKNSGIKARVKMAGLVKAKGRESKNPVKDVGALRRRGDGRFDNLHRKRNRKRADLVHLFVGGEATTACGAGNLPVSPRHAHPMSGFAVSMLSCLGHLTGTHEIGHNLGADHDSHVRRYSRMRYARGFVNSPANYITAMSYYYRCLELGNYYCVVIPYFSTPSRTYNGQPLASGKKHNNAKAIRQLAPRVARYRR